MPERSGDIRILASPEASRGIGRALSRRRLFGVAGGIGSALALAACGSSSSSSPAAGASTGGGALESKLNMYNWGEYDDPKTLKAFSSKYGPKITTDTYSSNEEMISKLVAAKGTSGYDIIVPTGVYIPQLISNGLLMKLDKSLIPNLDNVDPRFLGQEWDTANDYSVCKDWGTTGYVYDTAVIGRDLTSWADFIDAAQNEASGKTSVLDDALDYLGIYFWANGIDWSTTDDSAIEACKSWATDTMAPHIAAFDSYPAAGGIPQSKYALMQAWNGDVRQGLTASKDPDRWKWVLPTPKTEIWMDNWCIVEGAKDPNAAHAFINYILDPDVAFAEMEYTGYNTAAQGIEEKAKAAKLPFLDLVFFDDAQVATMVDGEINDAVDKKLTIFNEAKAAAGA